MPAAGPPFSHPGRRLGGRFSRLGRIGRRQDDGRAVGRGQRHQGLAGAVFADDDGDALARLRARAVRRDRGQADLVRARRQRRRHEGEQTRRVGDGARMAAAVAQEVDRGAGRAAPGDHAFTVRLDTDDVEGRRLRLAGFGGGHHPDLLGDARRFGLLRRLGSLGRLDLCRRLGLLRRAGLSGRRRLSRRRRWLTAARRGRFDRACRRRRAVLPVRRRRIGPIRRAGDRCRRRLAGSGRLHHPKPGDGGPERGQPDQRNGRAAPPSNRQACHLSPALRNMASSHSRHFPSLKPFICGEAMAAKTAQIGRIAL